MQKVEEIIHLIHGCLHQTGQTMEIDFKIYFLDHHLLFQICGFICSHHGTKPPGVFPESKVLTDLISSCHAECLPVSAGQTLRWVGLLYPSAAAPVQTVLSDYIDKLPELTRKTPCSLLTCVITFGAWMQNKKGELICLCFVLFSTGVKQYVVLTMNSEAMIPSTMAQKNDAMTPILMNMIAAVSWREGECRGWDTEARNDFWANKERTRKASSEEPVEIISLCLPLFKNTGHIST